MWTYNIAKLTEPLPELESVVFDPEVEPFCEEIMYAPIESYVWDANGYMPEARAYVARGEESFSVLLCANEETIHTEAKEYGGDVYRDSCLEFFFKPLEDDDRYMNIETNAAGAALIEIGTDRYERKRLPALPEGMELQVSRHKGGWWAVRYEIPFALIGQLFGRVPAENEKMRGNFYKCDETIHPHFGTWAPIMNAFPDFHQPKWFGYLTNAEDHA